MIQTLHALHRFCLEQNARGEFELYQALALGMTWLTLQPETYGQFFNVPTQVTNHSTALLLSPTYQAVWAHSFQEGLELYADLETRRLSLFRPEHGRIYQNPNSYHQGEFLKYPFQNFFHEMTHILLTYDVYPRVLGTPEEERSWLTQIEASVSCLEEDVMAELVAVRSDLNIIDDGFGSTGSYPEYGEFRYAVITGQHETGLSRKALQHFRKRFIQLGENETYIPENPIKAEILANFQVTDAEIETILPHFAAYIANQQFHTTWGIESSARNRIPGFREVIELLPPDPYCLQKMKECLRPDSWPTPEALLSKNPLPELSLEQRNINRRRWRWRELLCRVAEMRGFLQTKALASEPLVQDELFDCAHEIAATVPLSLTEAQHDVKYPVMQRRIANTLHLLQDPADRDRLLELVDQPFTYVLDPR
ncbi:hypothetical protein [Tumebacillus flagellatus]|nr:hypothetical protein [Tumebacillus flagellatus]